MCLIRRRSLVALLLVSFSTPLIARAESPMPRIRPSGIDGAVLLCPAETPEDAKAQLAELAEKEKARLTVIDPASPAALAEVLPGAVIHNGKENHRTPAGKFGLTIESGGALLVRGRELRAVGEGNLRLDLAASNDRPARVETLKPGAVEDLTLWRRAALARTQAAFPPEKPPAPEVPCGSLVIVGGGGMPEDVGHKFLELAGGPDAPIVVLPTSMPDPLPVDGGSAFLKRLGATKIRVLSARRQEEVESADSLQALEEARGIWFGGGRQWRFVDAYEGTKAYDLLHGVLRRGGVIGGSSAGATIQGDYLVRGSPHGPQFMMCEGYERGFAFLPGVAIDQHFSQRKRFADMTALMKTYPQYLGIGIDEATALVVQGKIASVMGRGQVHLYDRRQPVPAEGPDYQSFKAGTKLDLAARKVVEP